MTRRALLFAVLLLQPISLFASDPPAKPDLLQMACRQAALLDDASRPFVMDVDFTVQLSLPMQGHLRLRWAAKDRWWSRVSLGKFEQVKFQNGDRSYTIRNVGFTPEQINDLMNLLHVGRPYAGLVTRSEKQRTEDGIHLNCLMAQNPDPKFKREHFEFCVDQATHDIVIETLTIEGYARDEILQRKYGDYIDFDGHRYPRTFESFKNGGLVMAATVTALQDSPLDPKLLIPPAGAIERRECPDKTTPVMLYHPMPDFAVEHVRGQIESDAEITVQKDGTVSNVEIVRSGGRVNDEQLIMALKKWKFKPAMCGTEPVVTDMYEMFNSSNPFLR
ncbi:MAG TPA: energy transducer TonB [Terracidiphilus sp.]|nr:energy transducer TonB [Terracidiphilus sp.]